MRISELNDLQFDILKTAINLTKDGGHVVYSTCSISKHQNEVIVQRALEYFNGSGTVIEVEDYWGELKDDLPVLQSFGFIEGGVKGTVRINPENSLCGVMFICKFHRLNQE